MPDTWTDNGFSSLEAMDEAHQRVLLLVERAFQINPKIMVTWDLGCGNGLLLHKIKGLHSNLFVAGIDNDWEKCRNGQKLFSDVKFACHNINNVIPSSDLHLISVNRLIEDKAGLLFVNLLNFVKILVLYSYNAKPLSEYLKKFEVKNFKYEWPEPHGAIIYK